MGSQYKIGFIIFSGFLISLLVPMTFSKMNIYTKEDNNGFDGDSVAVLSDDEISYALSELSVDDLKTLSKLIDVLSEEGEIGEENDFNSQGLSELQRFKREISDNSIKQEQNVDEGYIRQLEESFPNIIDQPNQEDKEKNLIRVKRD